MHPFKWRQRAHSRHWWWPTCFPEKLKCQFICCLYNRVEWWQHTLIPREGGNAHPQRTNFPDKGVSFARMNTCRQTRRLVVGRLLTDTSSGARSRSWQTKQGTGGTWFDGIIVVVFAVAVAVVVAVAVAVAVMWWNNKRAPGSSFGTLCKWNAHPGF